MANGTLRLRSPYHSRRFPHVSRVRQILQTIQVNITHMLEDIPADGCDCRLGDNSRIILPSFCSLERQLEELRDALVQAGMRFDS